MHIMADLQTIAVAESGKVEKLVELMVAHAADDLLVVLGCPIPEWVLCVVFITQIADVAGKNKYVACYL